MATPTPTKQKVLASRNANPRKTIGIDVPSTAVAPKRI
jgi:hypothetical protein